MYPGRIYSRLGRQQFFAPLQEQFRGLFGLIEGKRYTSRRLDELAVIVDRVNPQINHFRTFYFLEGDQYLLSRFIIDFPYKHKSSVGKMKRPIYFLTP
jgi:hypothetical protein